MSKSAKAIATALLLGDPVSASSSSSSSDVVQPKAKKARVKKESDSGVGLEKRLIALLGSKAKGMSSEEVCDGLGLTPEELMEPINALLNKHRVSLLQDGTGKVFYQLVSSDTVDKLRGLIQSEMLLYQLISASGNTGIWIQDLKRKSSLNPVEIRKIMKELQKRRLVKEEKSVAAAHRKVYMLYDVEPAREVSGGVWYDNGGEFDVEYMKAIEDAIIMFLEKKRARATGERERAAARIASNSSSSSSSSHSPFLSESATPAAVCHFLTNTGAFKSLPSEAETTKILEGLVYEGRVDKREDEGKEWEEEETLLAQSSSSKKGSSSAAASSSSSSSSDSVHRPLAHLKRQREEVSYVYRFVTSGPFQSAMTTIPCASCPVQLQCHEGKPIQPSTCEYLAEWLNF